MTVSVKADMSSLSTNGEAIESAHRAGDSGLEEESNEPIEEEDCTVDDQSEGKPLAMNQDAELAQDLASTQPSLNKFRENWRRELTESDRAIDLDSDVISFAQGHIRRANPSSPEVDHNRKAGSIDELDTEDAEYEERISRQTARLAEALKLHLEAERIEGHGNRMHEAMHLYRRAFKLDPHIETRAYEYHLEEEAREKAMASEHHVEQGQGQAGPAADTSIVIENMQTHLERLHPVWEPFKSTGSVPFAKLPDEIVFRILVELVSLVSNDIAAIYRFGEVCRRAYLTIHDDECWRLVAQRLWGRAGNSRLKYKTFQDMCIHRPRSLCHGIYISVYQYRRIGEQAMERGQYTPHHLVVYYRYLRFFPDGTVVSVVSPDHPNVMVPKLKHPGDVALQENLFTGTYALSEASDGHVLISLTKELDKFIGSKDNLVSQQKMSMTLEIQRWRKNHSGKLIWKDFTSHTIRPQGTISTQFDLANYLPFSFSRVRTLAA